MIVVLDTHVVVSGLIKSTGHPAAILDMALEGRLMAAYCHEIIAEYDDVLRRPRFKISPEMRELVLEGLKNSGLLVEPDPGVTGLPDPDDTPFLAAASAANADCLITGNIRHFPVECRGKIKVVLPADFFAMLRDGTLGI